MYMYTYPRIQPIRCCSQSLINLPRNTQHFGRALMAGYALHLCLFAKIYIGEIISESMSI